MTDRPTARWEVDLATVWSYDFPQCFLCCQKNPETLPAVKVHGRLQCGGWNYTPFAQIASRQPWEKACHITQLRCKPQIFIFLWNNHGKYIGWVCLTIVHKTGIKSNSSGHGRTLFIKSYIFRSVLSDYAQSYRTVPAVMRNAQTTFLWHECLRHSCISYNQEILLWETERWMTEKRSWASERDSISLQYLYSLYSGDKLY